MNKLQAKQFAREITLDTLRMARHPVSLAMAASLPIYDLLTQSVYPLAQDKMEVAAIYGGSVAGAEIAILVFSAPALALIRGFRAAIAETEASYQPAAIGGPLFADTKTVKRLAAALQCLIPVFPGLAGSALGALKTAEFYQFYAAPPPIHQSPSRPNETGKSKPVMYAVAGKKHFRINLG